MSSHGGQNGASDETTRESSPYIELDRSAWAALAGEVENPLTGD
jgi:type I pantothenate kinase